MQMWAVIGCDFLPALKRRKKEKSINDFAITTRRTNDWQCISCIEKWQFEGPKSKSLPQLKPTSMKNCLGLEQVRKSKASFFSFLLCLPQVNEIQLLYGLGKQLPLVLQNGQLRTKPKSGV
jgi:hypothetical protein